MRGGIHKRVASYVYQGRTEGVDELGQQMNYIIIIRSVACSNVGRDITEDYNITFPCYIA